ncbi:MAG: hypothetical protein PGN19_01565 [Pseudomonas oryzihabitans]
MNKSKRNASTTNQENGSLVKIISSTNSGNWLSPATNSIFFIDESAAFPEIFFEISDEYQPPYTWAWTIVWEAKPSGLSEKPRGKTVKKFTLSDSFISTGRAWVADLSGLVVGGELTVTVTSKTDKLSKKVIVKGTNPTKAAVNNYLSEMTDVKGFEAYLEQESQYKHFLSDGEPLVTFDKGFGITQVTNPSPSYPQIWSWKENINAGVNLFKQKQKEARAFLGSRNRSFTEDQLERETLSRWNGGSYHVWNSETQSWQRKKDILCDSQTGNIGWPMKDDKNIGKSESDLRKRDFESYPKGTSGQTEENVWIYTGICYADHIKNQ